MPIGEDITVLVARRIRQVRKRQKLDVATVAERLGIAEKNYERMESGRQNLTLQTVAAVAGAFGVSTWELLVPPEEDMLARREEEDA